MNIIEQFKNINDGEKLLLTAIFKNNDDIANEIINKYNTDELILKILYEKINSLNETQQTVLKLSFGIDTDVKHTLTSISKIVYLKPATVSRIKSKSVRIIRWQLSNISKKLYTIRLHESVKGCDIDKLNLSTRVNTCFRRYKINSIDDILEMNAYDLISMRNFGDYSAREIVKVMRSFEFNDWADSIILELDDAIKSKNKPRMYDKLLRLKNYRSPRHEFHKQDGLSTLSGDYDGDILKGED